MQGLTSKALFLKIVRILFAGFLLLLCDPALAFKPWNHDYIVAHGLRQVKVLTPDGPRVCLSLLDTPWYRRFSGAHDEPGAAVAQALTRLDPDG